MSDYRNIESSPAERFQNIVEALNDSWPKIELYNTVTNFKLETPSVDGQIHITPREDRNEIITFPSANSLKGIRVPRVREGDLKLVSQLSSYSYMVLWNGCRYVKHDVRNPDDVDRFIGKICAFHLLLNKANVIQLVGLVTDQSDMSVTGVLVSHAHKGSLAELLRNPGETIPWERRKKWAKQIVNGLTHMHEADVVHGNVTPSKVMIDGGDDAQITGMIGRGCLKGWDAPELRSLIENNQPIAKLLNMPTDIYQLGKTFQKLSEHVPAPNREHLGELNYLQAVITKCVNGMPLLRPTASDVRRLLSESDQLPPNIVL